LAVRSSFWWPEAVKSRNKRGHRLQLAFNNSMKYYCYNTREHTLVLVKKNLFCDPCDFLSKLDESRIIHREFQARISLAPSLLKHVPYKRADHILYIRTFLVGCRWPDRSAARILASITPCSSSCVVVVCGLAMAAFAPARFSLRRA
jgi:hypothetical protein